MIHYPRTLQRSFCGYFFEEKDHRAADSRETDCVTCFNNFQQLFKQIP